MSAPFAMSPLQLCPECGWHRDKCRCGTSATPPPEPLMFVPAPQPPASDPYATLRDVLDQAFAQAAHGKGKERHARGDEPFTEQYICRGARTFGIAGPLFQAGKKLEEAAGLIERGDRTRAEAELLGAINYIAAAVLVLKEDA